MLRAIGLLALLVPSLALAQTIRSDRPRMLINQNTMPAVRERCVGARADLYQDMKQVLVDDKMNATPSGRWQDAYAAMAMAFVALIEDEPSYARKGIEFLAATIDYHRSLVVDQGTGAANWEVVELRRCNHIAFDWLFDQMTAGERSSLGGMLLSIADAHAENDTWNHAYAGGYGRYENDFFVGVALSGAGVDDARAQAYFVTGVDFLTHQTLAGRNQVAGDDGGIQSGLGYAFYNYIDVEAFFLSILDSACGENRFDTDTSLQNFGVFTLWGITPGFERAPLCDDTDDGHVSQGSYRAHMNVVASRFGDARAQWQAERLTAEYLTGTAINEILWHDPTMESIPPADDLPAARHFEGLGWVVFRSGWTDAATWAVLGCGDAYYGHKHHDEGTFVIMKHGRLADDARERIYQTEGHNTLLIKRDEQDSGNQRSSNTDTMVQVGPISGECDRGDVLAFETGPLFSYVCADATKAYADHVRSFTRQFVHLMPDTFVIYDRVQTTSNAGVLWQIHSRVEPETGPDTITIRNNTDGNDGRLTVQTLLPVAPEIQKTYQHLVGSENTQTDIWQASVQSSVISPNQSFLHVLHATRDSSPTAVTANHGELTGAEVTVGQRHFSISFNTSQPCGGHMHITENGNELFDASFTRSLEPQAGYAAQSSTDGGTVDAGTDAGTDAGSDPGADSSPDAGAAEGPDLQGSVSGGCGCATGKKSGAGWAILAFCCWLLIRRRE